MIRDIIEDPGSGHRIVIASVNTEIVDYNNNFSVSSSVLPTYIIFTLLHFYYDPLAS